MTWTTPQPEFEPSVDALIAQLETMLRHRHQRPRAVMHQPPRERTLRHNPLPVGHRRDQPDAPCATSARPVPATCAKTPATEKAMAAALPRGSATSSPSSMATTRWRRGVVSTTRRTAQRPAHATPWACKPATSTTVPCRALSCPLTAPRAHLE